MNSRKVLLVACILLAACNVPIAQEDTTQAWIDAPLDGSNLPLAPYEIIFHATARGNPTAVELSINEQPISLSSVDLGRPLVTVRYAWDPKEPGRYTITARAQDSSGRWSSPHTHVVTIGGAVITVTISPTITTTPITITPSFTPSVTPMPPAQAAVTFIGASTDHFYTGDKSCGPMVVSLEAQVSDPQQMPHMVLFFRARDSESGKYSEWNNVDMRSEGGGKFGLSLQGSTIADLPGQDNWLIYQFIGTGADNQPVARTQVYGDIVLSICGRFIPPPPVGITPIRP